MTGHWFQRSQRAGVRPGRYDEHAGSAHRRIGAGLALAAAALALTATSPAANADTIDLPDIPTISAAGSSNEQYLGVAPLFGDVTYNANGTYTDLLGENVDTSTLADPLGYVTYEFPPGAGDSGYNGLVGDGITDPNSVVATLPGGDVGGSTFGVLADVTNGTAFVNDYEETPFYPTAGGDTPAINDVFAYLPTANLGDDSDLGFGVQYLDLPDASTPVDELNFFGSGGEILFSIPVTGDLLSSF